MAQNTWFVRPSGSSYGSGNGTSFANAWSGFSNIVWGAGGITAGDILYVCGTHSETLVVELSGSAGNMISIRGDYTGNPGIIDLNYNQSNCLDIADKSYIAVEGMIFRRSNLSGIHAQGAHRCEIRNCVFRSISSSVSNNSFGIDGRYAGGLTIYGNSMNGSENVFNAGGIVANLGASTPEVSVIENNTITSIEIDGIVTGNNVTVSGNTVGMLISATNHADGIVIQGSNAKVKQNTVYDCTQCIYVNSFDYGAGSQCICDNVSIWGNLVYGTSAGQSIGVNGISIDAETGGVASINNLKIYNNTVVDCNYNGMTIGDRVGGRLNNVSVVNNIVVNCGGYNRCINFNSNPATNVTLDYNDCFSNYDGSGQYWSWYGTARTLANMQSLGFEQHGKSGYPDFTQYTQNASGNVYTLAPSSIASDAGCSLASEYAFDRDGRIRPQGLAWDIGAYEYGPELIPGVSISANPMSITPGGSSTLTWNSSNATSCSIDHGIGSVGLSGSIAVSPAFTTTYSITATGFGQTATDSVTVTVSSSPEPPTVNINATPATINPGGSSTLSWVSTNATSCSIDHGIGSVAVIGSTSVNPASTTIYTITAIGPGGTATSAVTVIVSSVTEYEITLTGRIRPINPQ